MGKKVEVHTDFLRKPGSVFVDLPHPSKASSENPTGAWIATAKSIASDAQQMPKLAIEEPVSEKPDLTALLAKVDAIMANAPKPNAFMETVPRPKPSIHPVMQAELKRCADYINKRAAEERAYQKTHNVAAKRAIAMKRLETILQKKGETT